MPLKGVFKHEHPPAMSMATTTLRGSARFGAYYSFKVFPMSSRPFFFGKQLLTFEELRSPTCNAHDKCKSKSKTGWSRHEETDGCVEGPEETCMQVLRWTIGGLGQKGLMSLTDSLSPYGKLQAHLSIALHCVLTFLYAKQTSGNPSLSTIPPSLANTTLRWRSRYSCRHFSVPHHERLLLDSGAICVPCNSHKARIC